ncbi:copper resistance D family protein [Frankia sp. AgB32]|uniref:copper resistance D family protein n=1 Tax=Frankia sp. AgB32 TaxID=631119 RepID=UPI00200EEEFD|nr:CopD family protein [Frankia sp. AgB32]MCK9896184.1 CopD family protein [Frankia sp. AgB32]
MPAASVASVTALPAPSTPLGPFQDSALSWATWITLMGFVGIAALALFAAGPAARRAAPGALAAVTSRLATAAVVLGVLAVPAVWSERAHDSAASGGFDYGAAWDQLYTEGGPGLLFGLEITLSLVGAALLVPLTVRSLAAGPARPGLLAAGLLAGAVSLWTTKLPVSWPDGRTAVETGMWILHLTGGACWLGGLAGLVLLALPGALRGAPGTGPAAADGEVGRAAFWSVTIRRYSAVAMGCVATIGLSGLFLYWEHVDGPSQLVSTMYGRVLGVKILIFGTLLVLGAVNQFFLHPRIEALRAADDERPLRTILTRHFPVVVGIELLLVAAVLFVAPFLHGSARNQAFQADAAKHATSATATLPTLEAKSASTSTWIWGSLETVAVIAVMTAGYRVSGRAAARRAAPPATPDRPHDPDRRHDSDRPRDSELIADRGDSHR